MFEGLFWLQISILMGDVLDAGAILLGVQVMVTQDYGFGITPVQFLKQSSHGSLLSLSARVGGLTADIEPALVADADRVGVVVHAVCADHPFRTAWLYRSVPTDHVVVADTELPALTAMPRIYLSGRTRLVGPYCRTVDNDHGYDSHMQLLTKNVVITRVINDPANFRIFPILVRLNFIHYSLLTSSKFFFTIH